MRWPQLTQNHCAKTCCTDCAVLSGGLMRSEDVSGGEEILVVGYPLGNMVSEYNKSY